MTEENKKNKPFQYETLSGNKMLPTFDPQLIANFHEIFEAVVHRNWEPVYPDDLNLNKTFDFFKKIVTRVKKYNESYDMTLVGDRGLGKSASGLAAAIIMHREFVGDPDAEFPINHVCFDVQSWIELVSSMKDGGVVVLDEVGTEGSLSSRTSMSKGNRSTSDVIQLIRTSRVITIYISIDRGRIDKRVRELTSIMGTPLEKLTNQDTNDYGLAISCDFRIRATSPANDMTKKGREDDSGYLQHKVTSVYFSPKGKIKNFVLPHPPIEMWDEYETVRDAKLTEVRERALGEYAENNEIEDVEVTEKVIEKKEKPKKEELKKEYVESSDVSILYI